MNEAAILAARRNLKEISKEEIGDALERIVAGPEKKGAIVTEAKKRLVAYHEVRPLRAQTPPFTESLHGSTCHFIILPRAVSPRMLHLPRQLNSSNTHALSQAVQ